MFNTLLIPAQPNIMGARSGLAGLSISGTLRDSSKITDDATKGRASQVTYIIEDRLSSSGANSMQISNCKPHILASKDICAG